MIKKLYKQEDCTATSVILRHNCVDVKLAIDHRYNFPAATDLRHAAKIPTGPFTLHPGIVFCTAEQMYSLDKGAVAFPISLL